MANPDGGTTSAVLTLSVISSVTADKAYPTMAYDGGSGTTYPVATTYDGADSTATGTIDATHGYVLRYGQSVTMDGTVYTTSGVAFSVYARNDDSGSPTGPASSRAPLYANEFLLVLPAYLPSLAPGSLTVSSQSSTQVDPIMAPRNVSGAEAWSLATGSVHNGMQVSSDGTVRVRYGDNDSYDYLDNVTGSVNCGVAAFGSDPAPNVSKTCSYETSS